MKHHIDHLKIYDFLEPTVESNETTEDHTVESDPIVVEQSPQIHHDVGLPSERH